jgi:SAM-dependent methyltransferase
MTTLPAPQSPTVRTNRAHDVLFDGAALAAPRIAQVARAYEGRGILHSEMLAACGAFDLLGCDLIVESGRCRAQSTSILAAYFAGRPVRIVSVELTRDETIAPFAEHRLAGCDNVELLYGDSLQLLPLIMAANPTARIGLLIDGPKSYTAIKLIERLTAASPNILVACLHDTGLGSDARKDLNTPLFDCAFTDHPDFVRAYHPLDAACAPVAVGSINATALNAILAGDSSPTSYGPTLAVMLPRRAGAKPASIKQSPPELTHDAYLALQLERSTNLKAHDPGERARYLISKMAAFVPTPARVLCVGCRNGHELDHLAAEGYTDTVGIDLHSADPRIRVMDMHSLAFEGSSFDAVYASHSLEHALDPRQVAGELERVVRVGGVIVIEVPILYGRRGADLWDYESPQNVAALFTRCRVLWSESGPQIGGNTQRAARVILRRGASA